MTLAATAHDGAQAAALAREHHPALAIVDVRMPGGGPQITRTIREASPDTKILAYSAHDDPKIVDAMHEAGAAAYLLKSTPVAAIRAAIRDLAAAPD